MKFLLKTWLRFFLESQSHKSLVWVLAQCQLGYSYGVSQTNILDEVHLSIFYDFCFIGSSFPGERLKVTSSGRVMAAGGTRSYPSYNDVAASSQRMYLSTGKAHVRRKVDCWMSFEEYDRLTQWVARGFIDCRLHGVLLALNSLWPSDVIWSH